METFTELLSPAFRADPGRHCQPWLKQAYPVLPCALGGWAVLGHAALVEAARVPAVDGCPVPAGAWPGLAHWPALLSEGLFARQGDDHTAARGAMRAALGADLGRMVAARAAGVGWLADGCDLTEDLARPLMTGLWADLTGLDAAELADLISPMAAFASFLPDPARAEAAETAAGRLLEMFRTAAADAPLLMGLDDAGRGLVAGMTIDAVDTAPAGLAGALAVLLRVGWHGDLSPQIAEEAFRLAAPAPATVRQTTAAVRISGVEVPSGALVWMVWAAGDHDPARHAAPMAFRTDRPAPHRALAFGSGRHGCLGHGLVRQVLAAVWPHFRARNAQLDGQPTYAPGVPRAPRNLRLRLT